MDPMKYVAWQWHRPVNGGPIDFLLALYYWHAWEKKISTETEFDYRGLRRKRILRRAEKAQALVGKPCSSRRYFKLVKALAGRNYKDDAYWQCELGRLYREGRGCLKNGRKSHKWFEMANRNGLPIAEIMDELSK